MEPKAESVPDKVLEQEEGESINEIDDDEISFELYARSVALLLEEKNNFEGDSDAMIVRGLVAILAALYNGLTVSEVLRVDAGGQLARLELNLTLVFLLAAAQVSQEDCGREWTTRILNL